MEKTHNLTQFRDKVYQNFNKRADTLMDVLDALCSQTRARSVVELSLESCFQRTYSALFKAIDAHRPREGTLAQLASPHLPHPAKRPFWLVGVDVTPQPRLYARTLEACGFVYQPTVIWGTKPITIGHQYSTVALLPEKAGVAPAPWVVPLACQRVKPEEFKTQVGAAQIGALLDDEKLPFHAQLVVEVADSDYSQPAYLVANREHENLVSLIRCRGNRTFFHQKERSAAETGGAPGHYGAPFRLRDDTTWHAPEVETQFPGPSRRGRRYQVVMQAWHNMLMRGKNKPQRIRMSQHPFTLVRMVLLDEHGHPAFKRPLWLLVVGKRRQELSLEHIYQAYPQRSDLEHFFRFGKQKLLLTAFQTPEVAREERWWHLVHLAYQQLWVAKDAATCLSRPWERSLPQHKAQHITPTQVQRDFARLISQFGTPAKAPKPRGKSSGRKQGFHPTPRPRHKVLKKGENPPP